VLAPEAVVVEQISRVAAVLIVPHIALDDAQAAVEIRAGILVRIAWASKLGAEGGAKHPAPGPGVVQFRGHAATYHA
jgi:hypothetical protein